MGELEALAGWILRKIGDRLLKNLGWNKQKRAFQKAVNIALVEFGRLHFDIFKQLYHNDLFYKSFEDELLNLLSPDGQPNIESLVEKVHQITELPSENLTKGLKKLFDLIETQLQCQPDLLNIEALRTSLRIKEDLTTLCSRLSISQNIEEIDKKARVASEKDLALFHSYYKVSSHSAKLSFRTATEPDNEGSQFKEDSLIQSLLSGNIIILEGEPGAGKTTTLLQLGRCLYEEGDDVIPVFFSLPEWASSNRDFLDDISHRSAFNEHINLREIQFLAKHGHLVLLLDGWNELSGEDLKHARNTLNEFRRNYPYVGTMVGTRPNILPPSQDRTLQIVLEELSYEQRDSIILGLLNKQEAEKLIAEIRGRETLKVITRIPLYLHALIEVYRQDSSLPETREQLLHAFIRNHETQERHAIPLEEQLFGFHTDYLTALGIALLTKGTTAFQESEARATVSNVAHKLCEEGQLSVSPQPTNVLRCLTQHHLLICSGSDDNKLLRFQHHQFQEWYASCYIAQLIVKANSGCAASMEELRTKILNIPRWEEALLFAIERLSRSGADEKASVAKTITQALYIDPLLAAEIIFNSDESTWSLVKDDIVGFAGKWHNEGKVDRGLAFMIATGRPEFSEKIWPLITHEDHQIQLGSLRAFNNFRIGVLGENWEERLSHQPEEIRKSILSEIAFNVYPEGLETAVNVVIKDQTHIVLKAVLSVALFKNSKKHIQRILENASDEVWIEFVLEAYPDQIQDNFVHTRAKEVIHQHLESAGSPIHRLRLLLRLWDLKDESKKNQIFEEIENINEDDDVSNIFILIEGAAKIDQSLTSQVLINRFLNKKKIWRGSEILMIEASPEKREKLCEYILENPEDARDPGIGAKLLASAEVTLLLNRLLKLSDEINTHPRPIPKELGEVFNELRRNLKRVPISALTASILEMDDEPVERHIGYIVDILAYCNYKSDSIFEKKTKNRIILPSELKKDLRLKLKEWSQVLIKGPQGNRNYLVDIALVLGRIGETEDLPLLCELLDYDIEYRNKTRKKWIEDGRRSPTPQDMHMSFTNLYREAFEKMPIHGVVEIIAPYLKCQEFCKEAVFIIRHVWISENRSMEKERTWPFSPDFSSHRERFMKLEVQGERPEPDSLTSLILNQIEALIPNKEDSGTKEILFSMANAVADMKYGNQITIIQEVIKLEGTSHGKYACLTKLIANGEKVDASDIKPCYEKVLSEWQKEPWNMDNHWYWVEEWLELLALSDTPSEIINIVRALPDRYQKPRFLEGLLHALSFSAAADVDKVILAFADIVPSIEINAKWLEAISNHLSEEAGQALLTILWDPTKASHIKPHEPSGKSFAEALTCFFKINPDAKKEFLDKLDSSLPEPILNIIGAIIEKMFGDEDTLLASLLIFSNGKPVPFHLQKAIENHVTQQEPIHESGNIYNILPSSAKGLRKRLFEMVIQDTARKDIARKVLIQIDDLRDEYGRPEDEPRHPWIESGYPYPILATR